MPSSADLAGLFYECGFVLLLIIILFLWMQVLMLLHVNVVKVAHVLLEGFEHVAIVLDGLDEVVVEVGLGVDVLGQGLYFTTVIFIVEVLSCEVNKYYWAKRA